MANVATLLLLIILSLTLFPSSSDGSKMKVVGSRPPKCANRCSSCRPCMAALVIIGRRQGEKLLGRRGDLINNSRDQDDHDNYYLLSWKCRCGDNFFPPYN